MSGLAVAHDQPPALLIDFVLLGFDVGGDLGFDGGHQHLTGSVVQQLVERRGLIDFDDLWRGLTGDLRSFHTDSWHILLFPSRETIELLPQPSGYAASPQLLIYNFWLYLGSEKTPIFLPVCPYVMILL